MSKRRNAVYRPKIAFPGIYVPEKMPETKTEKLLKRKIKRCHIQKILNLKMVIGRAYDVFRRSMG